MIDPTRSALDDLRWLQRLALALAHDRDDADELVQQTLVAAWDRPRATDDGVGRGWLAGVLRNRFRMLRRAGARRAARERGAGQPEIVGDDPEREHARIELLRWLLVELERLPDEDRSLVVRRYFDGERAAEIASALGLPPATVRSRLSRVLARLRAALEQRGGPRWSMVWVPANQAANVSMATPRLASWTTASLTALGAVAIAWSTVRAGDSKPSSGAPLVAAPRDPSPRRDPIDPAAAAVRPMPNLDQRVVWSLRRAGAELALRHVPPAPTDPPERGLPATELRALVDACIEDLDSHAAGALSLGIVEVGAPDIGTIIESIDVITETLHDPALLECIEASIYGFVGPAPEHPYRHSSSRTFSLGDANDDAWQSRRAFEMIVAAHATEIGGCQRRTGLRPSATLTLELTIDDDGRTVDPTARESGLALGLTRLGGHPRRGDNATRSPRSGVQTEEAEAAEVHARVQG
jgi:RNA polymerase sigma-70 factor, ECF subfamily